MYKLIKNTKDIKPNKNYFISNSLDIIEYSGFVGASIICLNNCDFKPATCYAIYDYYSQYYHNNPISYLEVLSREPSKTYKNIEDCFSCVIGSLEFLDLKNEYNKIVFEVETKEDIEILVGEIGKKLDERRMLKELVK